MASKLLVITKCHICGDFVEEIPDGMLKKEPHQHNVEMVVTHSGHKQYFHTSCWDNMIHEQQELRHHSEASDRQKAERLPAVVQTHDIHA